MMRTLGLFVIFLFAAALCATAQTDLLLTQYYEVPSYYNPAATGTTDLLRLRVGSRMQWVGIDNAPRSFLGVADTPFRLFGRRFGGGMWIKQERMGLYEDLSVALQLSYSFRFLGGSLSVGLQPGMLNEKFRGSEVFIPDDDNYHEETDEAIPRSDMSGSVFDMGAGIVYSRRHFSLGVGCSHLMSPTVTFSSDHTSSSAESGREYEFKARRTLYFTADGNIELKRSLFELMPSMMVATDFNFTRLIATARVRYKQFLSFGAGYRHDDAVSLMLGAEYKGFFLGYSYDYPLTEISRASSGSHEVMAGYSLKLDFGAKNRYRQKSIRIM